MICGVRALLPNQGVMRKLFTTMLLLCLFFEVKAQYSVTDDPIAQDVLTDSKKSEDYRLGFELNPNLDALRLTDKSQIKLDGFFG